MKAFCVFFLLGIFATANAQTRVHAHNDYLNAEPCTAAYKSGAWSIEADVFLVNGKIMVAHTRDEVKEGATLEEMYLQKIKNLTAEKGALPMQLMIDIKDDFSATYPVLEQVLKPYFTSFRNKVQVTISGKRPDHATFNSYPAGLFFDGLPGVNYRAADLKKVTMISADFKKYAAWKGEGKMPADQQAALSLVIQEATAKGKPMRFWGAPDNEATWGLLARLGATVINTDKVNACYIFINSFKNGIKE